MCSRSARILAGRDLAHEGARHFRFEHAAHREDLPRFSTEGAATKAPRAGSSWIRRFLRQLEQGLAHQRARDAEVVGQLLLGQLGAGCSRCSTMARVSDSTMKLVVDDSMRA